MRIRCSGSFLLAASLDEVMPLFTAEGERAWAPGWEPIYPDSAEHQLGQVWTTAGPPSTTWVSVLAEPDRVSYARVADGDSAGTVSVSAAAAGDATTVTVAYDLTALSPAGEDRLRHFEASYDDMLEHWQELTTRALDQRHRSSRTD